MKTMIKRAADQIGIELISSRRTYSLLEWLLDRERSFYPQQKGYIGVNLAPPSIPIKSGAIPLPEEVRGDSWSFASLSLTTIESAPIGPILSSATVVELAPCVVSEPHLGFPTGVMATPPKCRAPLPW